MLQTLASDRQNFRKRVSAAPYSVSKTVYLLSVCSTSLAMGDVHTCDVHTLTPVWPGDFYLHLHLFRQSLHEDRKRVLEKYAG